MAKTNELLSAVENKSALVVNTVSVVDDAIVINFTSDWVDKKKTMPLTDKWLKIKDGIAKIFASADFDPNSIWDLVKEDTGRKNRTNLSGILADCCIDLAKEAKARQQNVENMFAELGLSTNPIDAL